MSIEKLYSDMAELTFDHCKKTCQKIGSCCEPFYCEIAITIAKDVYGLSLERTGNYIPLLNVDGSCIAPPHVRPMCSLHSCDINSLGFFKNDLALTERYFDLRNEIEVAENQNTLFLEVPLP